MMRGLFVTGTGTGVGKTVVSAALMYRLGRIHDVRYWKPVQTGIEHDDDTAQVKALAQAEPSRLLDEGIRLPRAVSPHLAARLAGASIALEPLLAIGAAQEKASGWIVEGAGGVLVPLNDSELMVDLMRQIGLPAVVVARSTLGTINHTLLTLEALRSRSIPVAGVVMVGPPDADNRAAIEKYGRVAVAGELPWLEPLTAEALERAAARLDPHRLLERVFQ